MEQARQDLIRQVTDLKRRLRETTDPAAATVISDDIADAESRLRAMRTPDDTEANRNGQR
jgi:hypothetical protein